MTLPVSVTPNAVLSPPVPSLTKIEYQPSTHDEATPIPLSAWQLLMSGGVAGATAKTIIAPGDRVKILFQTDAAKTFSYRAAVGVGKGILAKEGLSGLWRGHPATLARIMPYAAINYTCFEHYRSALSAFLGARGDEKWQPVVRFFAGALAGATGTSIVYPLEVLRARMAVDTTGTYNRGYFAAASTIVANEGVHTLYRGLRASLLGILPYAGLSFMVFETAKSWLRRGRGSLSVREKLAAGALAGVCAQSATYPLDVVKRRLQVGRGAEGLVFGTIRAIVAEEGVRKGLYKGLSMNWIKGPVAVGISFTVNDTLKHTLQTRRNGSPD